MDQYSVRELISIFKDTTYRANLLQIPFLAAAVAYYALFSVVPILAIVVVVGVMIGGEPFVMQMLDQTTGILTPETQEVLADALVGGVGRVGATALGSVALVWSAFRVFRAIDQAFSRIHRAVGEKPFISGLKDGISVIAVIIVGVVVVAAVHVLLQYFPLGPLAGLASMILLFLALIVVLLPMYYIYPQRDTTIRGVLPGATIAALGWVLLSSLYNIYVTIAGDVTLYGPIGGVLLLLALFYAASLVIMYGAVLNVVIADRQLQQSGT
ncbi:YihY/virulence factor BrkB family protein [Salinarchaeum sp. IM2453]|uniref:YihY/virulence factor BrkB family protein n=1 Tax=Salinarchaeum sp. IM2453 TaxID=2862870 RepID=UPI001C8330EF|nr:YihY/virulence factor BrkB family protein [Salinarchaeum sp. IM2453]QZA89626.1 YihY/virulence factor BrkB family protein [Salinarchaeum sp. IM2453]